jgi:hypothetical protein
VFGSSSSIDDASPGVTTAFQPEPDAEGRWLSTGVVIKAKPPPLPGGNRPNFASNSWYRYQKPRKNQADAGAASLESYVSCGVSGSSPMP